jgi:hypothetical protein
MAKSIEGGRNISHGNLNFPETEQVAGSDFFQCRWSPPRPPTTRLNSRKKKEIPDKRNLETTKLAQLEKGAFYGLQQSFNCAVKFLHFSQTNLKKSRQHVRVI